MWVLGGLGICIALLVAVAIVVFIVLSRQLDRDLAAVDAHIPTIEAAIAGDARFEGIELDSYTAHAGSLSVDGYVLRQADVNALQAIIAGTAPPRPVDYHVNVLTAEQIERNVRLGLFGPATTQPGGPLAPPAAAATAVYRITLTNEAGEIASGELKLPDPLPTGVAAFSGTWRLEPEDSMPAGPAQASGDYSAAVQDGGMLYINLHPAIEDDHVVVRIAVPSPEPDGSFVGSWFHVSAAERRMGTVRLSR